MRRFIVALLLLLPISVRAQDITVFAAASLTDAMRGISDAWIKEGHAPLILSQASSSTLARQLDHGASANIFASADSEWMDWLAARNLIANDTRRDLLSNQLVLIVPSDKPQSVAIEPGLDLAALLGRNGRIATGDPAHVPVGCYAQQALTKLGLWNMAKSRLAPSDSVRSALLLVERGEAPVGIVYATDAAASRRVKVAGTFPADSHDPITYPFAVTRAGDTPDARALLDFIEGQKGMAIFAHFGFVTE